MYSNVYTSPEFPSIDAVLSGSNGLTVSTPGETADVYVVVSTVARLTANIEDTTPCVWRKKGVRMKMKVMMKMNVRMMTLNSMGDLA